MTRKQHPRELRYSRVSQWQERMADKKTVPGYSGTLDMADAESIRAYVRDALAMNVDPSVAGLKRLEMLEEHAAKLDEKKPAASAPTSIDDLAAARERLRQDRLAERHGK